MADLIERQAVLDALWLKYCNRPLDSDRYLIKDIRDIINSLPSAQPDLQPTCNQLATDCISRQAAIDAIEEMQMQIMRSEFPEEQFVFTGMSEALNAIKRLPSAQPEFEKRTAESAQNVPNGELISRKAVIEALATYIHNVDRVIGTGYLSMYDCRDAAESVIEELPSAQPEPLTDKEQRIFLAAMSREEKVCEEVDRNYVREPYEDSLMSVCREIKRKVKGALWT